MKSYAENLVFELSSPGRVGVNLPISDVPSTPLPSELTRRSELKLPELDELTVVRHFTSLSQKNYSIDTHFYPLGSCTMKYNPKINEAMASLSGFINNHPLIGEKYSQGSLKLIYELTERLKEIGGFAAGSVQAASGAQGELAGVLIIHAYFRDRGETKRKKILIPDSAHGTNPASCAMAGLDAVTIPSDARGNIDIEALKKNLDDSVAGIMLTNPSTLGLFESNIAQITQLVHEAGALVYGDGANMNALTGIFKPGEAGIDIMHYNLHKTFSTPHGGGGPGGGFVGVCKELAEYLPGPIVQKNNDVYFFAQPTKSIGRLKMFNGNFGVLVRAYTYISMLGATGLLELAETAVINANYLRVALKDEFPAAYDRVCMHEFVASGNKFSGVHTIDIAKRLIDLGFHPPTIYFPLIVPEAMMIEPTETESKETLDGFIAALKQIAQEARTDTTKVTNAPLTTPVSRMDEVAAARNPVLCYKS